MTVTAGSRVPAVTVMCPAGCGVQHPASGFPPVGFQGRTWDNGDQLGDQVSLATALQHAPDGGSRHDPV